MSYGRLRRSRDDNGLIQFGCKDFDRADLGQYCRSKEAPPYSLEQIRQSVVVQLEINYTETSRV